MGLLSGYESIANKAIPQYGNSIIPQTNYMDYINKAGGYINDGLSWMDKYSQPIGTLGGLYSAYNQQHMANKMYGLQKDAYNYNKMLSEREKKKQDQAQASFQTGFTNSNLGA